MTLTDRINNGLDSLKSPSKTELKDALLSLNITLEDLAELPQPLDGKPYNRKLLFKNQIRIYLLLLSLFLAEDELFSFSSTSKPCCEKTIMPHLQTPSWHSCNGTLVNQHVLTKTSFYYVFHVVLSCFSIQRWWLRLYTH